MPEEQKNTNRTTIYIIGAVALIAGVGIGWVLCGSFQKPEAMVTTSTDTPTTSTEESVNVELEQFKDRIQRSGVLRVVPKEAKALGGVIKEVGSDMVIIEQVQPMNPFADPALDERTVKITEETKFLIQYQRDPEVFEKERTKWYEGMTLNGVPENYPPAPLPYEMKEGSLGDLKTGQGIRVTAVEDVFSQKEFSVATVEVLVPADVTTAN